MERPALVEMGEQQQVRDEHRHALRLLRCPTKCVVESRKGARSVELKYARDRRERRAQLVGRVGDELPELVLHLLSPVNHDVECLCELSGLGPLRLWLDPTIELTVRDGDRGVGDPLDRRMPSRTTHHPVTASTAKRKSATSATPASDAAVCRVDARHGKRYQRQATVR